MSRLWLTPVRLDESGSSVTLSEERFELQPAGQADLFLALMKSVHSRLLVPFKANLLLSEDAELACGTDELPFELASGEPVMFGSGPAELEMSHCAQAYMDRLPSLREAGGWLRSAAEQASQTPDNETLINWIDKMLIWHNQGYAVALLKEENG